MSRGALALAVALAGCGVDVRSADYECGPEGQCDGDRTCVNGWCIDPESTPDAVFICAPGCTRCESTVCVIDCNGDGACGGQVVCPTGMMCRIECGGTGSCGGGISCTAGTGCAIECGGDSACGGAIACGTARCNVTCSGDSSCTGGVDCNDACACDTHCTGSGACDPQPSCPPGNPCEQGGECRSGAGSCDSCPG